MRGTVQISFNWETVDSVVGTWIKSTGNPAGIQNMLLYSCSREHLEDNSGWD